MTTKFIQELLDQAPPGASLVIRANGLYYEVCRIEYGAILVRQILPDCFITGKIQRTSDQPEERLDLDVTSYWYI